MLNYITSLTKKEIIINKSIVKAIGISLFVILTSIGAYVRVYLPFTPVPVTLQTFFVFLSGAVLGRISVFSQSIYVLLGVIGLPVFAGGNSGFLYLIGPTGGYLIGFIFSSYLIGRIIENRSSYFSVISSMILGIVIIYSFGIFQLNLVLNCGFKKAFLLGVLPFILGDLIKLLIASSLYSFYKKRLEEIFL